MLPSLKWLCLEIVICIGCCLSEKVATPYTFISLLKHICIGGCCGILLLIVLWMLEKKTMFALLEKRKQTKQE